MNIISWGTRFAVHIRDSCQKFKENNLLVIGVDT